ncbi:glycoside hydrolase family 16 protein [Streptomyces monomycini]|uniref:glycoside hydrolase family 16 protein n=1 Tax=Streptomyces monomycini TaxID=371720 RepID=UPI001EEC0FC1|nr:glycoside hydrolase family 16 protein [Streptomyces monomycini]
MNRLLHRALVTASTLLVSMMLPAPPGHASQTTPSEDACHTVTTNVPRGDCGSFRQTFAENFNGDTVPLGAFSDCDHQAGQPEAFCDGLRGKYRADWWAYPTGWSDTAASGADGNDGRSVGGRYHPEDTVSVGPAADGDGRMRIRMWRPPDGGPVHAAAIVPKAAMHQAYGKFSARLRVTRAAPGYKSAWLHHGDGCEIDYPEQNWTDTLAAFHHPCTGEDQDAFPTEARWTAWHTVSLEWTPEAVRFYLDGRLIGRSTDGVPTQPLTWVLQNESALDGPYAAPGSSAELQITWVTVYTYEGAR